MKRLFLLIMAVLMGATASAQSYYNLRHTWGQIDDAVATVLDSLSSFLAQKQDAEIAYILLPENPGVPIVIDAPLSDGPQNTEHGYIFAVGGAPVLRAAAHTTDGSTPDAFSLTIGAEEPEAGYALTVSGAAIATRWDVAGADFAEYFEASQPLPAGVSVCFTPDGRVRPAYMGDVPFGITSLGAGFVGNSGRPASKYLTSALGDTLYQTVDYVMLEREGVFPNNQKRISWVKADKLKEIPDNAPIESRIEAIPNPDYGLPHTPHRQNPDMVLVGIIGQIPLRKGQPVAPNWFFIRELDKDTDLWLVK